MPAPGSQGVVFGRIPAMPGSIGFFIMGMIIIALGAVPGLWSIAIPVIPLIPPALASGDVSWA
jgi:hypothetical protein